MRVLITGGTGFVGGAAAARLIERGDRVVVLARSRERAREVERLGADIASGDLLDRSAIAKAAAECDVIVHAAGLPRPATWRKFRAVHIEGTRNVIEGARSAGVRRVVNIASQAVLFAGRDLMNMNEEQPYPARYIDPYSETKAAAERLALCENGRGGLEVTSLRPALVWGPGDTTVLPIMARLARSPMGVPMCGDGSNFEATTYIDNLVDGIVAAIESARSPGRSYFVVDGFRVTWMESLARPLEAAGVRAKFGRVPRAIALPSAWMLDHAAGALGLPVPLAYFGVRTAMTSRVVNSTRARDELGYVAKVGWEEGLAALGRWVESIGGADALMRAAGVAYRSMESKAQR